MIPVSLTLRNCRTFDHIELQIPQGLLAILGSNGAGKSTLINAIDVALFGPEGRSLADWYPRQGGQDALQIELVFDHDGERFRVRRSFSPKGRGQSKTDLERQTARVNLSVGAQHQFEPITVESQRSTTEVIESLIGLSRDTFRASSFLAQGETGRFCEAQPRQRKQILAEIIGLADWDQHLERARTEKRTVESELDRIAGQVEQGEGELQERSLIAQEHEEAKKREAETVEALDAALSALATAREALTEERAKVERRAAAEKAVQQAEAALADLQHSIIEAERRIAEIDERLAKRAQLQELAGALPALRAEQETLRVALSQWQQRQRLADDAEALTVRAKILITDALELERRAISALEHIGEDACDRCGQTLHEDAAQRAAQSYRDEAAGSQAQAEEAGRNAEGLREELASLPAEQPDTDRESQLRQMIREREPVVQQLAGLDEAERHRQTAVQDLEEMRAELPERDAAAAKARSIQSELGPHDLGERGRCEANVQRHEGREAILRADLSATGAAIARSSERLARLDKIAATISGLIGRRDELQTERALLTNLERAAGPNGVPALILENVAIPQIETEASRILARLGGPAYAVELRTLREKKTGGISDTLDIVCLTHDGDAPYETFSGGERARIAFALRLALAQLLASRKGSATGLLVIDELEGVDAQGIAALVEVLEELQRSIPTIIVVSHVAELRDAFENTLMVENVDGRSRIVTEVAA